MDEKNKKNFLIISGPCAIENKQQFYNVAKKIHAYTHIIRAGVWKARTSPKDYSGCGEQGLIWAKNIQEKYQTPIAIEVGNAYHVKLAIKYNIQFVWLGARTTANPFSVQEIADSLKKTKMEVWIKNPIIPDMKLWSGAISRFQKNGINKLKIIHRGFYSDREKNYRNRPRWQLVNCFKKSHPDIPIICDPSHISGDKRHVYKVAQNAFIKKYNGLMIEVHPFPQKALSDNKQQLTPIEFRELLKKLNL